MVVRPQDLAPPVYTPQNRGVGAPTKGTIQLTGVRAVKALPDRVEVHTEGRMPTLIPVGIADIRILAKDLGRHLSRRKQPVATFLYFPDGDGATLLVEERNGRYALMVTEDISA